MASENIPSLFEYGARLLARDTGEFSDYSVCKRYTIVDINIHFLSIFGTN